MDLADGFDSFNLIIITKNEFTNAFIGSLAADAFSMPMHWYYDANAWMPIMVRSPGIMLPYLLIPTVFCGGRFRHRTKG